MFDNILNINIGRYHNLLLYNILNNYPESLYNDENNEEIKHAILENALAVLHDSNEELINTDYTTLQNHIDILLENGQSCILNNFNIESDIIEECLETMNNMDYSLWHDYVTNIATVINLGIGSEIDQNSAELIIGSLSIAYYSYNFWRTRLPNPHILDYALIFDSNMNFQQLQPSNIFNIVHENCFVGVPIFNNSTIETIIFFDDLNPIFSDLSQFQFIQIENNTPLNLEGQSVQFISGIYQMTYSSDLNCYFLELH